MVKLKDKRIEIPEKPPLLRLNEFHAAIGGDGVMKIKTLYKLVAAGKIVSTKVGGTILIPRCVLDQMTTPVDTLQR